MPSTASHHPVTRVWRPRRAHAPLLLIVAAFAVLAATYGVTMPLGETPDELAHYRYVRYIDAAGHPPRTAEERAASGYKGHEPPLYYLFLHRATAWLRVSERPMLKLLDPDLAPRHTIGAGTLLWNAVLHTADESFPWRGTSLAWHLMRLLSIPLGMMTILGVYRIGRLLAPGRRVVALLAAGLTALTPQFVYLGGALNNDNLAIPLSVFTLVALVAIATGDLRWRQFLLVGLFAGLARITKFHTVVLLPVIGVSLVVVAWRRRRWGRCALGGAMALVLIVLVSAPWILAVRPDPSGAGAGGSGLVAAFLGLSDTMHAESLAANGGGGDARGILALLGGVLWLEPRRWALTLFASYWAFFGQMTVAVGRGIYLALALLCLVAVLGALRLLASRRSPAPGEGIVVLALAALAFLGVELVFYALMRRLPDTAQGRHLYPALPAWTLLLAVGLLAWAPPRHAARVAVGLLLGMAGLCVYVLPAYALPAYEPALPIRTSLPAGWQPDAPGEGAPAPGIAYRGCGPAEADTDAHGRVSLTLLWQATAPIADDYVLRVEFADAAGDWRLLSLGHPAGGRWPTRAWDPGDYVHDRWELSLPPGILAGRYPLRYSWVDGDGRPVGDPVSGCHLVADAFEAPRGVQRVAWAHSGDAATLRDRDTLILTAPADATDDGADGLTSDRGAVWHPDATETYPTAAGDLWRAFYRVGPRTPPGRYALPEGKGAAGVVRVVTTDRRYDAPEDLHPADWRFDDGISLIGYRLEAPDGSVAAPGQTIGLVLAWRAEAWVPRNYTAFTHLVAADGALLTQHDAIPREGYATLFWAPGEVVVDYHPLVLPADASPGEYRVLVGLYTRPDGARLPVIGPTGAEDTLARVATIQVQSGGND